MDKIKPVFMVRTQQLRNCQEILEIGSCSTHQHQSEQSISLGPFYHAIFFSPLTVSISSTFSQFIEVIRYKCNLQFTILRYSPQGPKEHFGVTKAIKALIVRHQTQNRMMETETPPAVSDVTLNMRIFCRLRYEDTSFPFLRTHLQRQSNKLFTRCVHLVCTFHHVGGSNRYKNQCLGLLTPSCPFLCKSSKANVL